MRIFIFSILTIFVGFSSAFGQEAKNPFELNYRLKYLQKKDSNDSTSITKQDTSKVELIDSNADSGIIQNPVEESGEVAQQENKTAADSSKIIDNLDSSVQNNRDTERIDLLKKSILFWIFLFLLLLLTLMISLNRVVLTKVYKSLLNDNYLNLIWREQKGNISMQYLILYVLFIINAGLFFYLTMVHYQVEFNQKTLLFCILIVAAVYFIRHSFLGILSFIFPIQKELNQFSFTIMIFNIFLGMCLLPLNAIIAFAPDKIASFVLILGLVVIGIMYIYRQLRGIFIGRSFLVFQKFHFFLYLCAIEIAPLLVLLKFTNSLIQS